MEFNLDDFSIDIYYDAYHITRGNRRGGGVVIYTANELSCNLVETKSFALDSILECVTVELAIENPQKCCGQLYVQNARVELRYVL